MQFTIPQFIEKEAKIVGPLTFKQFIFIGTAGSICIFFYFVVTLPVFIIITVFLLGGAFSLAFLKIKKTPIPLVIKNFFIFLFKPKIYLWKKKSFAPRVLKKAKKSKKTEEIIKKESPLKVGRKGRLGRLFTSLETKK